MEEQDDKLIFEDTGYFKMHWELWPLCNDDCRLVLLMEYIVDIYNSLGERTVVDDVEYRRLPDTFIQERINYSSKTIKKYLEELEAAGLINIHKVNNNLRGVRYIHLNIMFNGTPNDTPNYDKAIGGKYGRKA